MSTTLVRRNPLFDLSEFRGMLDPFFSDVEAQLGFEQNWSPAIDAVRNGDHVTVRADVPGIKPEDIKIEAEDGILTLSGEMSKQVEKKGDRYLRRERRYGSFSRTLGLPKEADLENIEATCANGVLELTIPLPSADKTPKKVEIKASAD